VHPLLLHPAYNEVRHLPIDELLDALREPARRHRVIHEVPNDGGLFEGAVLSQLHKYSFVGDDIDYEPDATNSVTAIARRRGVPAMELVVDHLLSDDGHAMLLTPFFNYVYGDLSFCFEAHQHPHTRMGLGDAGAHCGAICDGGTPTFMLTFWTRDRTAARCSTSSR
jgi:N-acyl-D-amino-acid deacylase